MKKLYILLSAAAVIFSASATDLRTPSFAKQRISIPETSYASVEMQPVSSVVKSMRKADANSSIEGLWTFNLGDVYFDDSQGLIAVDYEATLDGTTVTFTPVDPDRYEFVGTYNASQSTITFSKQYLREKDGYYMYQIPFVYNWQTEEPNVVESIVAQYFAQSGAITFQADNGIQWRAFNNQNGTQGRDYYDILDMFGAFRPSAGEIEGNWSDVGMATLIDGWVLPGIGVNQFEHPYEVMLQQDADDTSRYRLVNPYLTGPAADVNLSTEGGYIVFNISDPNHVQFELADAGFINTTLGITKFFAYNQLCMYMLNFPQYSANEIIALQGPFMTHTTYRDGAVRLNMATINGNYMSDAVFGVQAQIGLGGGWTNDGQRVDMTTRIYFPGYDAVESVEIENQEAVEFYNLQGIRVANPEAGQLLIKRTGNKASKVIF